MPTLVQLADPFTCQITPRESVRLVARSFAGEFQYELVLIRCKRSTEKGIHTL